MKEMTNLLQEQALPELAIFEGEILVSASAKAAEHAAIATESSMVSGLRSMLNLIVDKVQTEEEALASMLNSFGFGPMFAVV